MSNRSRDAMTTPTDTPRDECMHCTLRGNLAECKITECQHHHSWFIDEMQRELATVTADRDRLAAALEQEKADATATESLLKSVCEERDRLLILLSPLNGESAEIILREQRKDKTRAVESEIKCDQLRQERDRLREAAKRLCDAVSRATVLNDTRKPELDAAAAALRELTTTGTNTDGA